MKNKSVNARIERSGFHIPRSVQQSIPIKRIYKDGIFEVGGKFSQTWKFTDINYSVAGPEAQEEMFKAIPYKCVKKKQNILSLQKG